jgi:hypothetical protein
LADPCSNFSLTFLLLPLLPTSLLPLNYDDFHEPFALISLFDISYICNLKPKFMDDNIFYTLKMPHTTSISALFFMIKLRRDINCEFNWGFWLDSKF